PLRGVRWSWVLLAGLAANVATVAAFTVVVAAYGAVLAALSRGHPDPQRIGWSGRPPTGPRPSSWPGAFGPTSSCWNWECPVLTAPSPPPVVRRDPRPASPRAPPPR